VAAIVLFQLRDRAGESFGVVSERGVREPSFRALARVLASPLGSVSPVSLRLAPFINTGAGRERLSSATSENIDRRPQGDGCTAYA
jgi:hypothetical protein